MLVSVSTASTTPSGNFTSVRLLLLLLLLVTPRYVLALADPTDRRGAGGVGAALRCRGWAHIRHVRHVMVAVARRRALAGPIVVSRAHS